MKRLPALDYLRVVAAILVIAVHADSITVSPTNYLGGISWWFAMTVNTLGRASVPLFVMISGALIYRSGKSADWRSTLKRSWSRIIVPSLIWIPFYFWWMNRWFGEPLTFSHILEVLWTSNFGYLRYLFIVLGLYLATPWLAKIPKIRLPKIAWGSLVFMVVLELVRYMQTGWAWSGYSLLLWANFVPYYLLGAVLIDAKKSRLSLFFSFILASVALATAVIANYWGKVNINSGEPVWWVFQGTSYFWGQFSLTVAVVSLSLYYLFVALLKEGLTPRLDRLSSHLSSATFGIYLVHVMMLHALEHYGNFAVHQIKSALWLYYLEKIALIFLASYIFVLLVRLFRLNGLLFGETRQRTKV